ncbi:HAD-IA family hydrolase [Actinocorallia lasiicapitis]
MIKGVMFDFSGTLLRIEPIEEWVRAVLDTSETSLPEAAILACVERLEHFGAQPGGPAPAEIPPRIHPLWTTRDLTAENHRAAYTALTIEALPPLPSFTTRLLADALYDRTQHPAAWRPYPDTAPTLAALHERGIPVAVVSNIGWDLRPVFSHHALSPYIDHYLLSYEFGAQKPDPSVFEAACAALGLPPAAVLMVGDDLHADTGAAALGCPLHLVEPLPADARPSALLPVLALL